jgi:hypothetical protein
MGKQGNNTSKIEFLLKVIPAYELLESFTETKIATSKAFLNIDERTRYKVPANIYK